MEKKHDLASLVEPSKHDLVSPFEPKHDLESPFEPKHDFASPFQPSKNIPIGLYVLFIGELEINTRTDK